MQLQLSESKKIFKIAIQANMNRRDEEYIYRSVLLKETNSWFGYIEEMYDPEINATWYRFTGENWIGNQISKENLLEMVYPKRYDQLDLRDVDYLPLEHQSGLNQAILDALHYFYQTRVFQFPNYSPITFK